MVDHSSQEAFDNSHVKELYPRGYEMVNNGYPWELIPPGLKHTIGNEKQN